MVLLALDAPLSLRTFPTLHPCLSILTLSPSVLVSVDGSLQRGGQFILCSSDRRTVLRLGICGNKMFPLSLCLLCLSLSLLYPQTPCPDFPPRNPDVGRARTDQQVTPGCTAHLGASSPSGGLQMLSPAWRKPVPHSLDLYVQIGTSREKASQSSSSQSRVGRCSPKCEGG